MIFGFRRKKATPGGIDELPCTIDYEWDKDADPEHPYCELMGDVKPGHTPARLRFRTEVNSDGSLRSLTFIGIGEGDAPT